MMMMVVAMRVALPALLLLRCTAKTQTRHRDTSLLRAEAPTASGSRCVFDEDGGRHCLPSFIGVASVRGGSTSLARVRGVRRAVE